MANSATFAANLQHVPSIFEINASETLDNLIYPALSKIFDFFGWKINFRIQRYHIQDDLAPAITFLLQYLYLRQRGGSFGESFYGLQRNSMQTGELLSNRNKLLSAALLIGMPYAERKLKLRSTQHENNSWEQYALKAFSAYNVVKTIQSFAYLAKYSVSHSPLFRMLGLNLAYPQGPPKNDKTTYFILKSIELLAFFLQFLQWWYANNSRQKIGSIKDPKPIEDDDRLNEQYPVGMCPVCMQDFETPTACGVSGYVYCWKCIISHLKENKTCPVTGYPISIDDLIRIYDV